MLHRRYSVISTQESSLLPKSKLWKFVLARCPWPAWQLRSLRRSRNSCVARLTANNAMNTLLRCGQRPHISYTIRHSHAHRHSRLAAKDSTKVFFAITMTGPHRVWAVRSRSRRIYDLHGVESRRFKHEHDLKRLYRRDLPSRGRLRTRTSLGTSVAEK